jgi:hypothetical protein
VCTGHQGHAGRRLLGRPFRTWQSRTFPLLPGALLSNRAVFSRVCDRLRHQPLTGVRSAHVGGARVHTAALAPQSRRPCPDWCGGGRLRALSACVGCSTLLDPASAADAGEPRRCARRTEPETRKRSSDLRRLRRLAAPLGAALSGCGIPGSEPSSVHAGVLCRPTGELLHLHECGRSGRSTTGERFGTALRIAVVHRSSGRAPGRCVSSATRQLAQGASTTLRWSTRTKQLADRGVDWGCSEA